MAQKNNEFFELVFEVVRLIPSDRVTSYGAVANYLGAKRSSRMVGWAMNQSHKLEGIPAHRVVNRQGLLTGKMHFSTPTEMEELLANEGIIVKENQIENFNSVFWDPSIELRID